MSRNLLPGTKSKDFVPPHYYKQVCIYAFSKKELSDYEKHTTQMRGYYRETVGQLLRTGRGSVSDNTLV